MRRAVDNVRGEIADALMGREAGDQAAADGVLIALDGTPDKSRLGANAIVGASMAFAHASAASAGQPLYRYFAGDAPVSLPTPMLNIVNGGMHAEGSTDIQEFMVVPAGFHSFREALRAGVEVFHTLKRRLSERGMATAVGDEGGFAPSLDSDREAVDLIVESIAAAGYEPGRAVFHRRRRRCQRARRPRRRLLVSPVRVGARPPRSWCRHTTSGGSRTPSSASRTAWARTTGTAGSS